MSKYSAKQRFYVHRNGAKRRGIDFQFTFEEWNNWWLSHGIDKNFPTTQDNNQPCMCRYNDSGPYSPTNVYFGTRLKNLKDLHKNRSPGKGKTPWNKNKKVVQISGDKHWTFGLEVKDLPNSKPVMTPDGIFDSRGLAAKYYNVDPAVINYRIKTKPKEYYYV